MTQCTSRDPTACSESKAHTLDSRPISYYYYLPKSSKIRIELKKYRWASSHLPYATSVLKASIEVHMPFHDYHHHNASYALH